MKKMMETNKLSPARVLFNHVRENHNLSSFQGYNPYREAMRLAIFSQMKFDKDDFENMKTHSSYYTNTIDEYLSHHSQGRGQDEYSFACSVNNVSACHAFETYFKIKPFKIKARRVIIGAFYFISRMERIRVTGYQLDTKKILCVREELINENWTKIKHPSFTNSEWREFVKASNNFENY